MPCRVPERELNYFAVKVDLCDIILKDGRDVRLTWWCSQLIHHVQLQKTGTCLRKTVLGIDDEETCLAATTFRACRYMVNMYSSDAWAEKRSRAPSPTTTSFFFTSGRRIIWGGCAEGYDSIVGREAGSEIELLRITGYIH